MKAIFGPLVDGRTYRRLVYLLLALPMGTVYFSVLVAGIAAGLITAVVWVGVPILFGMAVAWRATAAFERRLAIWFLEAKVDPTPPSLPKSAGFWRRMKALFTEPFTWRSLAWLILKFPLSAASFVIAVVFIAVGVAGVGAPLVMLFIDRIHLWPGTYYFEGPGDTWPLVAGGVAILVLTPHVIAGLAWMHRRGVEGLLRRSAAERARELEKRTTVLEERTRLAQELHDAVGHTVTATTLQAGAAGHVFDDDPEYARKALRDIEEGGRRALGELDRILGIMREEDGANRAPAPGLESMAGLVDDTRRAGVPVELHTTGSTGDVPQEVGRALYRIAQEALTNVMKHAGSVETEVSMDVTPSEATLSVRNEAPSQPRPASSPLGSGRGLVGVRERVAAYGGTLSNRPTESGGYLLEVALPLYRPNVT